MSLKWYSCAVCGRDLSAWIRSASAPYRCPGCGSTLDPSQIEAANHEIRGRDAVALFILLCVAASLSFLALGWKEAFAAVCMLLGLSPFLALLAIALVALAYGLFTFVRGLLWGAPSDQNVGNRSNPLLENQLLGQAVVSCPACSQRLSVPTDEGDLSVRCPMCNHLWDWPP
jgi:DNA-directed RNA polymerase subunit RPC12/RpoP